MSEQIIPFIIKDIIWCIDKISTYTEGMDFEIFKKDPKTYDAVIRNPEVIGEAVNRLPQYFMNKYDEFPWNLMISTRNRLIHGYDAIDSRVVWDIINTDLRPLKSRLEVISDLEL